jgi:hypothetical protein
MQEGGSGGVRAKSNAGGEKGVGQEAGARLTTLFLIKSSYFGICSMNKYHLQRRVTVLSGRLFSCRLIDIWGKRIRV